MFFIRPKRYDVYDGVEGVKIGTATLVKENGRVMGYRVMENGGKSYFVPTTEVEFIDDSSLVLYPSWIRNSIEVLDKFKEFSWKYPQVKTSKDAKNIREIVDYQSRVHSAISELEKNIAELQKIRETIPIEVAKLVGRRMIGDVDFISFSREVESYEKKYKVISKNIEKSKSILSDIKNSPFFIKEAISREFKSIINEIGKIKVKSSRSENKTTEKNIIDEDGVLRISEDELKTIDEFLLSIENKKLRKKESR